MSSASYEKISKNLTRLLRHAALEEGVEMSSDGWVRFGDILCHKNFRNYNYNDVMSVIVLNRENRFSHDIRAGSIPNTAVVYVRATRGHTIAGISVPQPASTPVNPLA